MNALGALLADLRNAFGLLSILPVGFGAGRDLGKAYAYFPLVGVVIGASVALVLALPLWTPAIRAVLALGVWVVLTGGLHLDGVGDSCDGLLAQTTPERRREIMKDPRAGSWAVIGISLVLLLKGALLFSLASAPALVASAVCGRWALVLATALFPSLSAQGLSASFRQGFGRPQSGIAAALVVVLVGACALMQAQLVLLPLVTLGLVALVGRWAARRLGGGLTGDVYGLLCEWTECVCLLVSFI